MFDINKDISYVPFFINKMPFKNKTEKDFFIVEYGDTELWYILSDQPGRETVDSYTIEKNKDGTINWIREICYINDSKDNSYKISVDKDGNIIEIFPDGHVERKTVGEVQNRDIDFPGTGPTK